LIFLGAFALLQNRPFVEEKVMPWLRLIPFIAVAVLLIWELFSPFVVKRKMVESPKPAGFHQNPVVSSESAFNGDLQEGPELVFSDLQQKTMDILASEEVKQEVKAAAAAGTPPEFLKSFSNFKDYMISKGMTEFAILDQAPSHFQDLFQKHHSGKVPSDLDSEMGQRFIDMVQEFGYDEGSNKFLRTREVAIWAAARFNLMSDNQESISRWMDGVYTDDFGDTAPTPVSVTTLPEAIPADGTVSDFPFAAKETVPAARAPTGVGEDSPTPDTVDRGITPPVVEREKVGTGVSPEPPPLPTDAELETTLKERFSSERFERAMSTLDRYGREDGLRRLRNDDPEVAEQVERHRNRESRTEDSR
jgi:hypothetical protein